MSVKVVKDGLASILQKPLWDMADNSKIGLRKVFIDEDIALANIGSLSKDIKDYRKSLKIPRLSINNDFRDGF